MSETVPVLSPLRARPRASSIVRRLILATAITSLLCAGGMAGLIALWTKPVRARANAIDLARIEIPPFPAGFDAQARQELIQSTDPGFEDRSGYNPARLALLAIEAFFHLGNSNSPNCYSPISFRAALRIVNTLDPPKSGPQANRNGVIAVLLIDRLDKTLTKDEQLRLFLE